MDSWTNRLKKEKKKKKRRKKEEEKNKRKEKGLWVGSKIDDRLDKASRVYGMGISAEKTKLMTNDTSGINKEIKVNGMKLETVTSIKRQGSVVSDEAPSLRYSPGKHRRQQHLRGWNQFGPTGSQFQGWCAPLSHSSSCMLVNHGLLQQSCKEEYKSWKWGAPARYYASYSKTMLPTRKSLPRSRRQSDHTKNSWPLNRDANWSGMDMSSVHQVWPKPSCKAQWKGKEDTADRKRDGKATSGNGQTWSSPSLRGQWKTKMEKAGRQVI